ncbi:MAG TPA: AI-2E family transporter [Longimicrobiaceae bacterium]|jgi:predicted PurR-regulated permease PerM|nr:AI-2E family transporter [Longimicrobiaceae bacterium]
MPSKHAEQAQEPRSPYAVLVAAVFIVLLLAFVYNVAEVLFLFFIAALFSLYLRAITEFLEERLRFSRGMGILTALLVTLLGIVGVFWLVVPPVLTQTQDLVALLPAQITTWMGALHRIAARYPLIASMLPPEKPGAPGGGLGGVMSHVGSYAAGLFPYVFSGVHAVIDLFSVMVMGLYLALRPGLYREGLIALAPPVHRELVRDILADLGRTLTAWIGGQMLAMVFLGGLTWLGLTILGVPYALAFAVFTGVVVVVPFFGSLLSTLLPALFMLGTGGPLRMLSVVALGVVLHLIEGNFVHPIIMERQVNLPPVLSILSVLIMAKLLGVIGLLVAVPVLATVMVIVRRIYVHRLLEGKGFRRFVRDSPAEIRIPDGVAKVDSRAAELSIPTLLEEAGAAPR